ncbi:MAG: hypothetical protein V3V96_00030 [Acidiferrobacterales bacterium]
MRVQWTVIPPNAQATEGLGRCQSEAGTAERMDHPAERVRHGWRTPDFQANRERGAQKVALTEPMDATRTTNTPIFGSQAQTTPGLEVRGTEPVAFLREL